MKEILLKQALLGILGKEFSTQKLPAPLQDFFLKMKENKKEKEAYFLQLYHLNFAYELVGKEFQQAEDVKKIPEAPEVDEICLPEESDVVIYELDNTLGTGFWEYLFQSLKKANKKLSYTYVNYFMYIFNNEVDAEDIEESFYDVMGSRGEWLKGLLNLSSKNQYMSKDIEELPFYFQKKQISEVRKENPEESVALLQRIFEKENADNRMKLLQILKDNPVLTDEDFLESIWQKDRSANIRKEAFFILNTLEGSRVLKKQEEWVFDKIQYKPNERNFMSEMFVDNKSEIELQPLEYLPEMKAYYIEEFPFHNRTSDNLFLYKQIISRLPISFWLRKMNIPREQALKELLHNPFLSKEDKNRANIVFSFEDEEKNVADIAYHFRDKDTLRELLRINKQLFKIKYASLFSITELETLDYPEEFFLDRRYFNYLEKGDAFGQKFSRALVNSLFSEKNKLKFSRYDTDFFGTIFYLHESVTDSVKSIVENSAMNEEIKDIIIKVIENKNKLAKYIFG